MAERLVGFYWVKTITVEGYQKGEWEVAFFTGLPDEECWERIGTEERCTDEYFEQIGSRIICEYQ